MLISMDKQFSRFLYGFTKGPTTALSHCVNWKMEKCCWYLGALLTELSKAFHCLLHDVSLAKLNGYDFSLFALRLIRSYLFNRQQRTKINENSSEVLFGVSQGSISESFLTYSCVTLVLPGESTA